MGEQRSIRFEGGRDKIKPEEATDLEYVIESLAGRHAITAELLAYLARTKFWTVKRLREELENKGFRLQLRRSEGDKEYMADMMP